MKTKLEVRNIRALPFGKDLMVSQKFAESDKPSTRATRTSYTTGMGSTSPCSDSDRRD